MIDSWFIIFFVFFYTTSSFVCALFEGASRVNSQGAMVETALGKIMSCSIFTADSTLGQIVGVFSPKLWSGLLDMALFRYPALYGDFQWIQFIALAPLTVGIVVILGLQVMKLIRGVS